jgi:hypothetical protein
LEAKSRVWLVVDGVEDEAEAALNGRVLGRVVGSQAEKKLVGTAHPTRFEISELLKPQNDISIVLRPAQDGTEQQGGFEAVRLEIEEGHA